MDGNLTFMWWWGNDVVGEETDGWEIKGIKLIIDTQTRTIVTVFPIVSTYFTKVNVK